MTTTKSYAKKMEKDVLAKIVIALNGSKEEKEKLQEDLKNNFKQLEENRFKNVEECIKLGIINSKNTKEYTPKYMVEYVDLLKNTINDIDSENTIVLITNQPDLLKKKDIMEKRHPQIKISDSKEGTELLKKEIKKNFMKHMSKTFDKNDMFADMKKMFKNQKQPEVKKDDLSYIG